MESLNQNTPLVRSASAPRHCGGMGESIGLRRLLLGTPLGDREGEEKMKEELNRHINGMIELVPKVYGDSDPCKQAVLEMRHVVRMDSVACQRAMLLFGISAEKEMCDHWDGNQADGSSALAKDLQSRVLPFVVPRFFKHSCQCPDSFVILAMVLTEMWGGEKLGNWPNVP